MFGNCVKLGNIVFCVVYSVLTYSVLPRFLYLNLHFLMFSIEMSSNEIIQKKKCVFKLLVFLGENECFKRAILRLDELGLYNAFVNSVTEVLPLLKYLLYVIFWV